MKEPKLTPRKWACVVVAGGAVFALPFMQIRPPKADTPTQDIDVEATLPTVPVVASLPPVPSSVVSHPVQEDSLGRRPIWAELHQSPFETLIRKPATVVEVEKPSLTIMQPLRNASEPSNAAANVTSPRLTASTPHSSTPFENDYPSGSTNNLANPNNLANTENEHASPATGQEPLAQSQIKQPLPANAWPDERYSPEQVAQQIGVPAAASPTHWPADTNRQQDPYRHLASAVVQPAPEASVLPSPGPVPNPSAMVSVPLNSAVTPPSISRQPRSPSAGPQVRFGQSNTSANNNPPHPTLPATKKPHIIFQPSRH